MTKGIFQLSLNIAYNMFKVGLVLCSMAVIFDCRKADLKSMFLFHECTYTSAHILYRDAIQIWPRRILFKSWLMTLHE